MFRSIVDTIVDKIKDLNPISHFIKYALDRTINKFLRKKLELDNFKDGPLNLQNIQINTQTINQLCLISSPYVMHYGIIQKLNITLPQLSAISTKSIEIEISGIQMTLKPNKKFQQNFKSKMMQLHQQQIYAGQQNEVQGQISQSGPVDFFKELLKKIIINIKIKISKVVVKLYMNTPSENKENPQFYLMLRVPIVYVDKMQGKEIQKTEAQVIKFNILLPQVSLHLLREDIKFPQYKNLPYNHNDFPFIYPSVFHPSTLFILGSSNLPDNFISKLSDWKNDGTINNMNFTQIGFIIATDYLQKTRKKEINLKISNIQIMANPIQIKVISRFAMQIIEFKKMLDIIIDQLKFKGENVQNKNNNNNNNNNNNKKKNKDELYKTGGSTDLFSSIMMNFTNENSGQVHRQSGDLFKSMVAGDEQLRKSVREFNLNCALALNKKKGQKKQQDKGQDPITEFQVVQFKESTEINVELVNLSLYLLKYSTTQEYLRSWLNECSSSIKVSINKKIGCDYFLFNIKKIIVKVKANQNTIQVNVAALKLYNVKLHQQKDASQDEYFDISDSIDVDLNKSKQSSSINFINRNQIKEFTISNISHYCAQQMLSISSSEGKQKTVQQNIKIYSLIPHFIQQNINSYGGNKSGISVFLNSKSQYYKISVQMVFVSVNLQAVLDFLNIAFPLLAYRRLSDLINFKRQEINSVVSKNKIDMNKNLLQSIYECRRDVQQVNELMSENRNNLIIQIAQVRIGYRNGEIYSSDSNGKLRSNFDDLIKRQKDKICEEQVGNKQCFCSIDETAFYFQIRTIKMQNKNTSIKISIKDIQIGIMKINKSQIHSLSSILSVKSSKLNQNIRFLKQNTYCETFLIFVPQLRGTLSEDNIINIACFAANSIKIVGNILSYGTYLYNEMMILEQTAAQLPKKAKKGDNEAQKQVKVYIEKISIQLQYCSFIIEQIYLRMNQQMQQALTCKISKVIGGVKREHDTQVMLCQFKNDQMKTTIYNEQIRVKQHQKLIYNSDIFVQIQDEQKLKVMFKQQQRSSFFERLDKQQFNLMLSLSKKQTKIGQGRMSSKAMQKYQWNNKNFYKNQTSAKQKFHTIQEEAQKKIIAVDVCKPVKIYVCSLLEIKKKVPQIKKFMDFLKSKAKQIGERIKEQRSLLLMDRKPQQVQIQSESLQIKLRIMHPFMVDIFPDFINNKQSRIFSNTRSVICIRFGNQLRMVINNTKNQIEVGGELSVEYYFLKFDDKNTKLNPILIVDQKQLSQLGFKSIVQINNFSFKVNVGKQCKTISGRIKSIYGEVSIESLCLMQLHFQHLIKHHVENNLGTDILSIYDGDEYNVLEYDDEDHDFEQVIKLDGDDFQVQDLTGALKVYNEKLGRKTTQQRVLRDRKLIFKQSKHPQIFINGFVIERISIRISTQDDFNFITSRDSNDSIRNRMKQLDALNYYVMDIIGIYVMVDISKSIQVKQSGIKVDEQKNLDILGIFTKIQKIKISFSKQKNFGHNGLRMLEEAIPMENFIILNNQSQICVVMEKQPNKILVKSSGLSLNVGGTTEIVTTIKKVKQINQKLQKSRWKKIYENEKKQIDKKSIKVIKKDIQFSKQRLLIMIPQSSLKVTFKCANLFKIMNEQQVIIKQFILNEQINDTYYIKQKVRKYTQMLIKNNIGGLVAGTALNLITQLFSQLIALNIKVLSKTLGLFFQG